MYNLERGLLLFVSKWWITTCVLASLTMQIALLLTGGSRIRSSVCRLVAWIAYNCSDYIAITALASLAQAVDEDKEVYALWAPILLLHLGGPDNISAYARADSALWQRHGLSMIFQAWIALYVIVNCARGWKYIAVSACLAIAGIIKYAERTIALRCASQEGIVKSSLPIYEYMLGEYMFRDKETLLPVCGGSRGGDGSPRYHYILSGEKNWHRNYQEGESNNSIDRFEAAFRGTRELVTMDDILLSKDLNPRSKEREVTSPTVLVCLGYALFKLYTRRLSSLYMYEWRAEKTRQLFLCFNNVLKNEDDVLYVIDVELRFLFDSLYSKAAGTAYTKSGALLRLVTTTLLALSGVLVFRLIKIPEQGCLVFQAQKITLVLLVAALAVELYQLIRLVSSDWTRVWLACMYVRIGRKRNFYRSFALATLRKSMSLIDSKRPGNYRINRIGQYSMLESVSEPTTKKNFLRPLCLVFKQLLPQYEETKKKFLRPCCLVFKQQLPQYEESTEVEMCKKYIIRKVLAFSRERSHQDFGKVRILISSDSNWCKHIYKNEATTLRIVEAAMSKSDFYYDLEHLITTWHVATSICERLMSRKKDAGAFDQETDIETFANESAAVSKEGEESVDFQMGRCLSMYTTYLLVHKTSLLPCHADMGRRLAYETEKALQEHLCSQAEIHESLMKNDREVSECLRNGFAVAKLLQDMPNDAQRWSLIADVWISILIHIAARNSSVQEHLEQLTNGGELLTHLWVLLGHMGYGEQ